MIYDFIVFLLDFVCIVDVIKPKPPLALPRTAVTSNNYNNVVLPSVPQLPPPPRPDSLPKPPTIHQQSTTPATVTTTITNTNNNNKTTSTVAATKQPPDVLRRIAGKPISTLFEVRYCLLMSLLILLPIRMLLNLLLFICLW